MTVEKKLDIVRLMCLDCLDKDYDDEDTWPEDYNKNEGKAELAREILYVLSAGV